MELCGEFHATSKWVINWSTSLMNLIWKIIYLLCCFVDSPNANSICIIRRQERLIGQEPICINQGLAQNTDLNRLVAKFAKQKTGNKKLKPFVVNTFEKCKWSLSNYDYLTIVLHLYFFHVLNFLWFSGRIIKGAHSPRTPKNLAPTLPSTLSFKYIKSLSLGKKIILWELKNISLCFSALEHSSDINLDLKPIKIPKLKQDLIKPLT